MLRKLTLLLMVCLSTLSAAQAQIIPTNGVARRIVRGAALPVTCGVGDVYFLTVDPIGQYNCTATDVWEQVGSSGSPAPPPGDTPAAQGTFLASGGQVVWVSAFTYEVSAADYYIQSVRYTSAEQSITLTAANMTDNRIDVIALDVTGTVIKVTGTASSAASEPVTDPATQLKLAIVTVPAGGTQPSGASSTLVYAENAGTPTEWAWTTSGTGFALASTNNPRTGTKDIEGTAVANAAYAQGQALASFDPNIKDRLVMYIRSKATWNNRRSLQVSLRLSGQVQGTVITVASNGTFGFASSQTATYQQVAIPIAQFAITSGTLINQVRIQDVGGSIGFYIDDISFQTDADNGSFVPSVTSVATTAPILGGPITNTGTISCQTASGSLPGCLTAADWTTFNNKAPAAQPYDLIFTLSGMPADATTYPWIVFPRTVAFVANWSGAYCKDLTNATATATFTVKKNGSTVGTVAFATNGTCTFATSGGSAVSVVAGDYFTFVSPAQDATLTDIMVTIPGTR